MEKNGIDVLDQESKTIKIKDSEVTFYGISNAYFSPTFDLNNEFDIDRKKFNVLLAHIPMYSDYEKFGADLTLCGDTHGGVIQVPFLGPAYYNGKILPELLKEFQVIHLCGKGKMDESLKDTKGYVQYEYIKQELADLAEAILSGGDIRSNPELEKHADWVDEFLPKYEHITSENINEILQKEVGLVFEQVLEDAGVYKCTPEGREAFARFLRSVGFR